MSRPLIPLRAGAVIFTLLWTAWMMWWSGSFSERNVVDPDLLGTRSAISGTAPCAGSSSAWACCRARMSSGTSKQLPSG